MHMMQLGCCVETRAEEPCVSNCHERSASLELNRTAIYPPGTDKYLSKAADLKLSSPAMGRKKKVKLPLSSITVSDALVSSYVNAREGAQEECVAYRVLELVQQGPQRAEQ